MKTKQVSEDLLLLQSSHLFDRDWYLDSYPDVGYLNMDPYRHYLTYGTLMRRDPGPNFSTGSYLDTHPELCKAKANPLIHHLKNSEQTATPVKASSILMAAMKESHLPENHQNVMDMTRRCMPPEFKYTLSILEANNAYARKNEAEWLKHLNIYLNNFNLTPVTLKGTGKLLNRLSSDQCSKVTGGPLVTVVMVIRNSQTTVNAAAQSILNQTWQNLELLIVDDASDDASWSVLQKLAAVDSRVRIQRNKDHVGPYVSKNFALIRASGAWVTEHGADNWAHPKQLENHISHVLKSDGRLRATLTKVVSIKSEGLIEISDNSNICEDGIARSESSTCLYEKRLLNETLGFWDSVRAGADQEMASRARLVLGDGYKVLDQISNLNLGIDAIETNIEVSDSQTNLYKYEPESLYYSAWQEWHNGLISSDDVYKSFPFSKLNYEIPDAISVPRETVFRNARKELKRVVFLVSDATSIGGISSRTRKTLENQYGRSVEYISISKKHTRKIGLMNAYNLTDDLDYIEHIISTWSPFDTVIITSNNAIRLFPKKIQPILRNFPLIYWAAGQMAFMLQDSVVMKDRDYIDNFLVSHIIAMSEMDISFQRQLGIHNQSKGFAPIEVRKINSYNVDENTDLVYVGRIDFHAKDCERLIDIALTLKYHNKPPLTIFTTDASNSPDYRRFVEISQELQLENFLDIRLNVTDKDEIYKRAKVLILPSKKESFGNVIVEAYSYGVPVIGASFAPGPAELIDDQKTGLLLDSFYPGDTVIDKIVALTKEDLIRMSHCAFEKHKEYSVEKYLLSLEKTCQSVLDQFLGKNTQRVFPRLKILEN